MRLLKAVSFINTGGDSRKWKGNLSIQYWLAQINSDKPTPQQRLGVYLGVSKL